MDTASDRTDEAELTGLEDGTELEATVQDGWYLAWWPEKSTRRPLWKWDFTRRKPTLIRAYDANGELLKRLDVPK